MITRDYRYILIALNRRVLREKTSKLYVDAQRYNVKNLDTLDSDSDNRWAS